MREDSATFSIKHALVCAWLMVDRSVTQDSIFPSTTMTGIDGVYMLQAFARQARRLWIVPIFWHLYHSEQAKVGFNVYYRSYEAASAYSLVIDSGAITTQYGRTNDFKRTTVTLERLFSHTRCLGNGCPSTISIILINITCNADFGSRP